MRRARFLTEAYRFMPIIDESNHTSLYFPTAYRLIPTHPIHARPFRGVSHTRRFGGEEGSADVTALQTRGAQSRQEPMRFYQFRRATMRGKHSPLATERAWSKRP